MEAYTELTRRFARLHHLGHISSLMGWDTMVNLSKKGAASRAAATAELKGITHGIISDPEMKTLFEAAQGATSSMSVEEAANLREMRRAWLQEHLLPSDLVQRRSMATSKAQEAWQRMRPENDWAGFLPFLREVIAVVREEAAILSKSSGLSKYEALVDKYEPGLRLETIDAVFADIKEWLPGLISQVTEKRKQEGVSFLKPVGPFPVERQKALGTEVMKMLQFDFDAGRLDVSAHPFCGGVPDDVRLTTRYFEDNFDQSLMGIIHETGHARYEMNRPAHLITQPVSAARSMGVHESQSLFHEMQIGRSASFVKVLAPLVRKHLGDQAAFTEANLLGLYHDVSPGLIRVDADELCYPLHVILRYEIERALVEDDLDVERIPELWNAKMKAYLGLDTTENFKDGPLQDVHWSVGYIGYFPTYSIGAIIAAQLMAAMRSQLGDAAVDAKISNGEMSDITTWLREKVWSKGSILETEQLLIEATGEPLNATHYRNHLTKRYLHGL